MNYSLIHSCPRRTNCLPPTSSSTFLPMHRNDQVGISSRRKRRRGWMQYSSCRNFWLSFREQAVISQIYQIPIRGFFYLEGIFCNAPFLCYQFQARDKILHNKVLLRFWETKLLVVAFKIALCWTKLCFAGSWYFLILWTLGPLRKNMRLDMREMCWRISYEIRWEAVRGIGLRKVGKKSFRLQVWESLSWGNQ